MATVTPDDEAEAGLPKTEFLGQDEQADSNVRLKEAQKKSIAAKVYASLASTVEKDPSLNGAREQHVPMPFMIPIWLTAKAAFVVVLVYLTWTAFNTDQEKKYLSPNYSFVSTPYRLCELIPTTVSGTFLLDTNGYWEGTKDFQFGKAKYSMTLNQFMHDYAGYKTMMEKLQSDLAKVASNAKMQTVAQNLLTWMSYAWVYPDGDVKQSMRFTADPAVVINKIYRKAALISKKTACGSSPDISINEDGVVDVQFSMDSFAKKFIPGTSKGCCKTGTVFTAIGNPAESTMEISTTWGVQKTYTFTPNPNPNGGTETSTVSLSIRPTPSPSTSPSGMIVPVTFNMPSSFPTPTYANLRQDLVGNVLCVGPTYTGDSVEANCAKITSVAAPTQTPTPAPSPTPTARPTPAPTPAPTVPSPPAAGPGAGPGGAQPAGPVPSEPPTPAPSQPPTPAPSQTPTPASYAELTLGSTITIDPSTNSPVIIDTSKITLEDLSYLGVTAYPDSSRSTSTSLYPSLSDAASNFVSYSDSYPGYLSSSTKGDYTSTCVIDPDYYGYNAAFDTNAFTLKYSLRSLATAVAVNQGFTPLNALAEVFTVFNTACTLSDYGMTLSSDGFCQVVFDSVTYEVHSYIDPKYNYMSPIFCLERQADYNSTSDKFENLCVLKVSDSMVYPFFEHMGSTAFRAPTGVGDEKFYDPSYSCTCEAASYDSGYVKAPTNAANFDYMIRANQKTESYCNVFDLMHGFVMMGKSKNSVSDTTVNYALSKILQMATQHTPKELSRYAYLAGFASLRISYGMQVLDSPSQNNGWRSLDDMYTLSTDAGPLQFCNGYPFSQNSATGTDKTGNAYAAPDCSIFAMNTYDTGEPNIDQAHLNVMYPHCTDEFSIPNSSWARNGTWRYDLGDVPEAHNSKGGLGATNIPPASLTQEYYICYNKVTTSLALAFGSSAGTAGIAASVVLTLLVTVATAGWFKKQGEKKPSAAVIVTGGSVEMSKKR